MTEPLTKEREVEIRSWPRLSPVVRDLLAEIDRLREAVRLAAEMMPADHDESCSRRLGEEYRCRCDHGDRAAWLAEYGGER